MRGRLTVMSFRLPLQELLMRTYRAYTLEFERAMAEAGHPDLSLALGTNVLRFLDHGGLRIGAIAELAGVSKQAISQQVAFLEAKGYVGVTPDSEDSRAKIVTLTERGRESGELARPLFATIERRWAQRFGHAEVQGARAALETLVERLESSGQPGARK
jgi:DNA-binding MarR family transcriptional regulator